MFVAILFKVFTLDNNGHVVSIEEFEKTVIRIRDRFEQDGYFVPLQDLKHCYEFFERYFYSSNFRPFFKSIYKMESREAIRLLHNLSEKRELVSDSIFSKLMKMLVEMDQSSRSRNISNNERLRVLQLCDLISDLQIPPLFGFTQKKTRIYVEQINQHIGKATLTLQVYDTISREVSQLLLLKIMEEYHQSKYSPHRSDLTVSSIDLPSIQIPPEVSSNSILTQALFTLAYRIHFLKQQKPPERNPQYCQLIHIILSVLTPMIYSFLHDTPPSNCNTPAEKLHWRKSVLEQKIQQSEGNIRLKKHLQTCAYNIDLFAHNFYSLVKHQPKTDSELAQNSALIDIYQGT